MTETVTAENDDNSDGWTTQEDPSTGKAYLYNCETGETKWVDEEEEEKEEGVAVHSSINPLVDGGDTGDWSYLYDESQSSYYWYNSKTDKSQWAK